MLSRRVLHNLLQTANLEAIKEQTGISRPTLTKMRDEVDVNVDFNTVKALSDFFESQLKDK